MNGLQIEIGCQLAADTQMRLRALDSYDLSFCYDRWVEKTYGLIRPNDVEQAAQELKRFFSLQLIFPGSVIFPPTRIDACWHEFILFTPQYREFCRAVLGTYLDHHPRPPVDPLAPGPMHTLGLYRQAFGPPPMYLWGPLSKDEERWLLYQHTFPDLVTRRGGIVPRMISALTAGVAALAARRKEEIR